MSRLLSEETYVQFVGIAMMRDAMRCCPKTLLRKPKQAVRYRVSGHVAQQGSRFRDRRQLVQRVDALGRGLGRPCNAAERAECAVSALSCGSSSKSGALAGQLRLAVALPASACARTLEPVSHANKISPAMVVITIARVLLWSRLHSPPAIRSDNGGLLRLSVADVATRRFRCGRHPDQEVTYKTVAVIRDTHSFGDLEGVSSDQGAECAPSVNRTTKMC